MADTFQLDLVQNERYERLFKWTEGGVRQSFTGMDLQAEVRVKESVHSPRLLDITPYLTIESSGDSGAPAGDVVRMLIPGSVMRALDERKFKASAAWDMFADDQLIIQGPVVLDPAATKVVA